MSGWCSPSLTLSANSYSNGAILSKATSVGPLPWSVWCARKSLVKHDHTNILVLIWLEQPSPLMGRRRPVPSIAQSPHLHIHKLYPHRYLQGAPSTPLTCHISHSSRSSPSYLTSNTSLSRIGESLIPSITTQGISSKASTQIQHPTSMKSQ